MTFLLGDREFHHVTPKEILSHSVRERCRFKKEGGRNWTRAKIHSNFTYEDKGKGKKYFCMTLSPGKCERITRCSFWEQLKFHYFFLSRCFVTHFWVFAWLNSRNVVLLHFPCHEKMKSLQVCFCLRPKSSFRCSKSEHDFFLTLLSKLSCHALALINFDERKSIFTVSQTVETGEKKIDFSVMKTIFGSKSQRSDE